MLCYSLIDTYLHHTEYVQVKPILAVLTVLFKATNTYNDGTLNSTSGYTYVSVAYNLSVSLC